MEKRGQLHPDFRYFLDFKSKAIIDLFTDLRGFILEHCPDCYELLYNTHALTSVFSFSHKLSDAFCMIPIYKDHLNLGFNKGALLQDKNELLCGTGKLIRHIKIKDKSDYRSTSVEALIKEAMSIAKEDLKYAESVNGHTISKIKTSRP